MNQGIRSWWLMMLLMPLGNINAVLLVPEADGHLFFRFLKIKDDDSVAFSFHQVGKHCCANNGDLSVWPWLMKLQATCVNEFYEKLRLPAAVSLASKAIPLSLQTRNLEADQWLLALSWNPFQTNLWIPRYLWPMVTLWYPYFYVGYWFPFQPVYSTSSWAAYGLLSYWQ